MPTDCIWTCAHHCGNHFTARRDKEVNLNLRLILGNSWFYGRIRQRISRRRGAGVNIIILTQAHARKWLNNQRSYQGRNHRRHPGKVVATSSPLSRRKARRPRLYKRSRKEDRQTGKPKALALKISVETYTKWLCSISVSFKFYSQF